MSEALKNDGIKPITMTRTDGTIDVKSETGFFQRTILVETEPTPKNSNLGRPRKDNVETGYKHSEAKRKTDTLTTPLTWKRERPERKPANVYLGGTALITAKNFFNLIGRPSFGKSTQCEAILSKIQNKDCDGLGWSFSDDVKRAIWFDCERSLEDCEDSISNIMRRANMREDELLRKRIDVVTLKAKPRGKVRQEIIEEYIKEFRPNFIIIDGAGDLVEDTNSIVEASRVTDYFRRITEEHNVTILTTLHPNLKGLNDGSPRGAIGSELMRECQVILSIKKNGDGTRTITTNFKDGKCKFGEAESHSIYDTLTRSVISIDIPTPVKKLDAFEYLDAGQIDKVLSKITDGEPIGFKGLIDGLKRELDANYKDRINTGDLKIKEFKKWLESKKHLKVDSSGRFTKYIHTPVVENQIKLL